MVSRVPALAAKVNTSRRCGVSVNHLLGLRTCHSAVRRAIFLISCQEPSFALGFRDARPSSPVMQPEERIKRCVLIQAHVAHQNVSRA